MHFLMLKDSLWYFVNPLHSTLSQGIILNYSKDSEATHQYPVSYLLACSTSSLLTVGALYTEAADHERPL